MVSIGELLPIGSVVRLRDGKKNLMIFGVKQSDESAAREYDYIGVLYPEGNLGGRTQVLFNHEDIEKVVFRGYEDEERDIFLRKLSAYYAEH